MSRLTADPTLNQIDDWFTIGKKVADVKTVSRSKLGGRYLDPKTGNAVVPEKPFTPNYKRHLQLNNGAEYGTMYAQRYQEQEETKLKNMGAQWAQAANNMDDRASVVSASTYGGMENLDLDSIATGISTLILPEGVTEESAVEVYGQYKFEPKYNKELPITEYRQEIVNTIETNQVTVIQGNTGCGKTTQVPQYILDNYASRKQYCNIIVTQPRRIAAVSICRRVCKEREWEVGKVCGYQIGLEKTASEDTRLLYATTGILLQKLISAKTMNQYTHVILDEVHERDQDSDFCLLVVRKLLRTVSRDVKVILMSATIDTDLFARYFSVPIRGVLEPAPVITVDAKGHMVNEYYIGDLKQLGEIPELHPDRAGIPRESYRLARNLIMRLDKLELKDEGNNLPANQPGEQPQFAKNRGAVLIFLPGLLEIHEMDHELSDIIESQKIGLSKTFKRALPIHSSITTEEQVRVFETPAPGFRKIILATNIAESSITVPDIKYVIDFCLTRHLVCDPVNNFTRLLVSWASKASCTQRKGRAGRVSSGRVYRMVSRDFWNREMNEYSIPEMQRCPLEHLILRVKILDLGEPKAILGLALAPPNLDDIEKTILILKEVGALKTDILSVHDGELTYLGRVLADLPTDIRLGKLMLLGHVFGFLEEMIIIAACLSLKDIFSKPYRASIDAFKSKFAWSDYLYSDCLAALNAFTQWEKKSKSGAFHRSGYGMNEKSWCTKYLLDMRSIQEVDKLRTELRERLKKFNIITPRTVNQQLPKLDRDDEDLLMKVIIAGSFYPNYFYRFGGDEEDSARTMCKKNPRTTVMLRGLPANQGCLYDQDIIKLMTPCFCHTGAVEPKVNHEETKAYVEFPLSEQEKSMNVVAMPVYLAVKMRLQQIELSIQLLDTHTAREQMKAIKQYQENMSSDGRRLRTHRVDVTTESKEKAMHIEEADPPSVENQTMHITVTHIIDCGHFYAQHNDPDKGSELLNIQNCINSLRENQMKVVPTEMIQPGLFCLAPYVDPDLGERAFYRCRIDRLNYNERNLERKDLCSVEVFFIDYGNTSKITQGGDLKIMPPEMMKHKHMCFECQLCEIRPSAVQCPGGRFTPKAQEYFSKSIGGRELIAKVYSVVHGVVRLDLYAKHGQGQLHINQKLIDCNIAEKVEESMASKQDNMLRTEEYKRNQSIRSPVEKKDTQWMKVPLSQAVQELPPSMSAKGSHRRRPQRLIGPFSGYEMQFHNMTNVGTALLARIDPYSVNSVAFDTELHETFKKMMVAAHVGLNPGGSVMIARNTTIMPSIPGLPSIILLIFSPCCEMRTDPRRSKYIGALCGLGWDRDAEGPSLPDHDMEQTFDVEITQEDLKLVNGVRRTINVALGFDSCEGTDQMIGIQKAARDRLFGLLKMKRQMVEPEGFKRPYRWNQVDPEYIMYPEEQDPDWLLNMHFGIEIVEPPNVLLEHANALEMKASKSTELERITCRLCEITVNCPRALMLHLATKQHEQELRKLKQLGIGN